MLFMFFVSVNTYNIQHSVLQGMIKQTLKTLDSLKIKVAEVEEQVRYLYANFFLYCYCRCSVDHSLYVKILYFIHF